MVINDPPDNCRAVPLLSGLRVLELGHFIAAPFCTRLLGDLGADIIKVEPAAGDPAREWGEQIDGHSLWWSMHGRNKRSIKLDFKKPEGRELVLKLAEQCDAVIENFRPGHLARLGLGPVQLRERKPDLVVAHISGYGQDGPDRDRAAFGLIGESIGGLRHLTNHPPGTTDLPPVRVGVSIGDSIAGLYAAFGVMAALWERDRKSGSGIAASIDVALTESVLSLMEGMLPEYGALGKIKQPTGGAIPNAAPTNAYPTKERSWILIGANSDPLFARLAALLGKEELAHDARFRNNRARAANVAQLDHIISEWTRVHTVAELVDLLTEADIPNAKVYDSGDIARDPQFLARNMITPVRDPNFAEPVLHTGIVPRIPEAPGRIRSTGPAIGQHTEEILRDLLGVDSEEIERLRRLGVI